MSKKLAAEVRDVRRLLPAGPINVSFLQSAADRIYIRARVVDMQGVDMHDMLIPVKDIQQLAVSGMAHTDVYMQSGTVRRIRGTVTSTLRAVENALKKGGK